MLIREVALEETDQLATLQFNAYPIFNSELEATRENIINRRLPWMTRYGGFVDDTLVATYALIDYQMNLGGTLLRCGGISGVAAGLEHRKQRFTRELMAHALETMTARGMSCSLLYPFRTDFYQSLGWAPVAQVREYRFRPDALITPRGPHGVLRAADVDLEEIRQCYHRYMLQRNCMLQRTGNHWDALFKKRARLFCFRGDVGVEGYVVLDFRPDPTCSSPMAQELVIEECVYSSPQGLHALLAFLGTLGDQISRIIWYTPIDERIDLFLKDPTNGTRDALWRYNDVAGRIGIGIMLRLVDARAALLQRPGYNGVELDIRLELEDPHCPANAEPINLSVRDDQASLEGRPAMTLRTDIGTFSQIYAGYVSLSEAVWARRATLSAPERIPEIDAAFKAARAPFCLTFF